MPWTIVRNKKGSAQDRPPSGFSSWLEYWESKKGKATRCEIYSTHGCSNKADLGGHVYKTGESWKVFIIPMCTACNNQPENEDLKAMDSDLIPVP